MTDQTIEKLAEIRVHAWLVSRMQWESAGSIGYVKGIAATAIQHYHHKRRTVHLAFQKVILV